jgi:hypothetical protein
MSIPDTAIEARGEEKIDEIDPEMLPPKICAEKDAACWPTRAERIEGRIEMFVAESLTGMALSGPPRVGTAMSESSDSM